MKLDHIEWVDRAKMLAIACIIFGHSYSYSPDFAIKYVYSFHLCLFWFLAGYLQSTHRTFGSFFIRSIRRLIVPYFFFGILILFYSLFILRNYPFYLIDYYLLSLALFDTGRLSMASPLWFLPALFFVSTTFYLFRRNNIILIIFFALSFSGTILTYKVVRYFILDVLVYAGFTSKGLPELAKGWGLLFCSCCNGFMFFLLGFHFKFLSAGFTEINVFSRRHIGLLTVLSLLCTNILLFAAFSHFFNRETTAVQNNPSVA